ncbi:MAG TPA: DUF3293 domain-containing protein [Steroidobacteraceae bacterium]|nr:DUF3293 domain-containing protein [Steroidobacteraceae bacterium]
MTIDPATLAAYRQTEYRVQGSMPAVLRVGVRCPQLVLLHAAHDVQCSAFITACNPRGVRLDDAVNEARQQALAARLIQLGRVMIEGIGRHPSNDWPPEHSFLVPGLSRGAAETLGRQFDQNAIVWAGMEAVPELVLLR